MNFRDLDIEQGLAICVADSKHQLTFEEMLSDPFALREYVDFGEDIVLRTSETSEVLSALVSLDNWAATVHLLPPEINEDRFPEKLLSSPNFIRKMPETYQRIDSYELSRKLVSKWVIYTSGTAGIPKPVIHTLETLSRTVKANPRINDLIWGQIYDPNRMAGLQVILQSFLTGRKVVGVNGNISLDDKIAWFRSNQVSALSATPTLWRQILQSEFSRSWDLKQVTLGGEIADQKILDSLILAFPQAKVTHIFASTETGVAFAVSDGLAGFPAEYLETPPHDIPLQIRDGVLFVHNPVMATADSQGFVSTEDAVEIVGDRVLYLGRNTGIVNVGGAKVWPEEVENILRAHPLVQDAVVVSRKNPISGSILVASVVLFESIPENISGQLRQWVRENAPNYFVPAIIKIISEIETSEVGKARRE